MVYISEHNYSKCFFKSTLFSQSGRQVYHLQAIVIIHDKQDKNDKMHYLQLCAVHTFWNSYMAFQSSPHPNDPFGSLALGWGRGGITEIIGIFYIIYHIAGSNLVYNEIDDR